MKFSGSVAERCWWGNRPASEVSVCFSFGLDLIDFQLRRKMVDAPRQHSIFHYNLWFFETTTIQMNCFKKETEQKCIREQSLIFNAIVSLSFSQPTKPGLQPPSACFNMQPWYSSCSVREAGNGTNVRVTAPHTFCYEFTEIYRCLWSISAAEATDVSGQSKICEDTCYVAIMKGWWQR